MKELKNLSLNKKQDVIIQNKMKKKELMGFLNKFQKTEVYHLPNWTIGYIRYNDGKESRIYARIFKDYVYITSIKFPFNQEAIDHILFEVDRILKKETPTNYSKFHCQKSIGIFDSIIFIDSTLHDWFESFDAAIHKRTIWFFPIHHSELTGNDTKEVIARNLAFNPTIWDREIAPLILSRLNIPRIGFKNSKNYYEKIRNLYDFILDLKEDNDFIEISNYKGEKVFVYYIPSENKYILKQKEAILFCGDIVELKEYIYSFLTN